MDFSSYFMFAIIVCWNKCDIHSKHTLYYRETHSCIEAKPTIYDHKDYEIHLWVERCKPKLRTI